MGPRMQDSSLHARGQLISLDNFQFELPNRR